MRDVLQNTARKFKIYMADAADPTAGLTGLSSFTVYLSKESGAENTVSPTITERGHGFYEVTPTTAHRDTLGENAWVFAHAGAVDFPRVETVVAVDNQIVAYDALRPTTSLRTLDVSAAGNAGIDWSNIEAPTTAVALTGTTVSLTAAAVALVWDALTSGMSTVGSIGKRIVDYLTGDSYTRLGDPSGASIAADIAAVQTQAAAIVLDTNELQTDWANGGRLDLILDARASQTSVDTIDDLLDTEIPALTTAVADLPTNAELATAITTSLTTALTEGYRATNATGSVRDLLYEILQSISEFTISGTTKTVKKLDGSTTAKTYTLNDATTPTGITETT